MQVKRLRRRTEEGRLPGRHRRLTLAVAGVSTIALIAGGGIAAADTTMFGKDQVAQQTPFGQVLPTDQFISPYGDRLVINPGKIMSSTPSPDGTHLAASVTDGGYALVITDLRGYRVQQLIGNNANADLKIPGNDVGQEGPTYSPDGKQLWLGVSNGYYRFDVKPDGTLANPSLVSIPVVNGQRALVGAAAFSPDGSTVYAAVNGQNRVVSINAATGAIVHSWDTGIAPRDLALLGNKLYVSNEGGRLPRPGETTMNTYGTQAPADGATGATTTGTVSVIDTANPGAAAGSIDVGLHPTSLDLKNGSLFVSDTNSNDVSVIDPSKDKVTQTISTKPWDGAQVGFDPTSSTLTDDGHLLVTLGRANAVAVYRYAGPMTPAAYVGLIPTDYYPSEITASGNQVVVSNTRGIDARRSTTDAHGTHDTTSSLTRFTLPDDGQLHGLTEKVFHNNGWDHDQNNNDQGQHQGNPPQPIPAALGLPSTIKHVFLVVKENRTYDQMFGDMPQGNGDPAFTQFGQSVTPNNHALATQFGLYDNAYTEATNSAEGHNWVMQSDNPEYTESSAGQYTRSYDTENDVLGHQRSGFIWTAAQNAGKSVKDFGEFQSIEQKPAGGTWQNYFCDAKNMAATGQPSAYPIKTGSAIPSLNAISVPGFPLFDLNVPDVYKYEVWKQDFEKNGPAALNMFWLSNDHTGGPVTPAAGVADNDLALGKLVDTISHSPYWQDSAIFVTEDDSQAGLDHVDGHRHPFQIISPWANHGVVDDHYYTQIMMDRTIEQILGLRPMNQLDAAATPLNTAFTDKPDFTPYNAVPNQTPLTQGLKGGNPPCGLDTPAQPNAAAPVPSADVPANMQAVAQDWENWKAAQDFSKPDTANPVLMNHLTWYQTHGWTTPYPGESTVTDPKHVPGYVLPGDDGQ